MENSKTWESAPFARAANDAEAPIDKILYYSPPQALPLCVDLDGTLIKTDLLIESFLVLIKSNPLFVFSCLGWLLHGKARLKAEIARRVTLDMSLLPYNQAIRDYLESEFKKGRKIYLCTASDQSLAHRVAAHLGLFADVFASDGKNNLSGHNKARALKEKFGECGFDYCGNSADDVPIWKCSNNVLVVGPAASKLVKATLAVHEGAIHFEHDDFSWKKVLKAIRAYQWVKNALIFVPLLTSHKFTEWAYIAPTLVAFVAFSLCASSVYLLNDMLDLEADRRHERKRLRPFASGQLSLQTGIWLTAVLFVAGFGLALLLPERFVAVLAAYYALTVAYSFVLKKLLLVDVFALASLYTIRILAGGAAAQIPLSTWLILFSITIFLSLAFIKRYSELSAKAQSGEKSAAGRGYLTRDTSILSSFGPSSGYIATMILAIYLNDPKTTLMYSHRSGLWAVFALMLFWVSWMWMNAYQNKMTDDPIVFALKDRVSMLAIGLIVLCTIVSI